MVNDISNTNPQAAGKGVTIQFLNDNNKSIDNEYYVNADKSRIFQVLSNLISNALSLQIGVELSQYR